MIYTYDVGEEESEFIGRVIDFLKDYGVTEEPERLLVENDITRAKVIYNFKNPGWSIERCFRIQGLLKRVLLDYCSSRGKDYLMDDIVISFL